MQLGAKSNKNVVQQKRSAHHIHFDKTMHDIFKVFYKVKMRVCHYMQGKESLLYSRFFFQ